MQFHVSVCLSYPPAVCVRSWGRGLTGTPRSRPTWSIGCPLRVPLPSCRSSTQSCFLGKKTDIWWEKTQIFFLFTFFFFKLIPVINYLTWKCLFPFFISFFFETWYLSCFCLLCSYMVEWANVDYRHWMNEQKKTKNRKKKWFLCLKPEDP